MKAREHFCWLNFSYTKNNFGGLKKSSKKVWVRFMVNLFREKLHQKHTIYEEVNVVQEGSENWMCSF